jgi:DNA modification methylase
MDKKVPPLASKQLEPLLIPINDIKPHPENYKTHPADQIRSLKASLRTFAWTTPIKANLEGFIIAGHGMYQAALEEGYTHVPVEFCALDKQLSKAYLVADNETARRAVTEQDKLNELLSDISLIPDFDIEAVGFSADDIDSLLDNEPKEVIEDDFNPDQDVETRCKVGDLWALGSHRLLCADSSIKENIIKLMGNTKAEMVLTDPPYGVKRDKGFEGFGGFGTPIKRRQYEDDWDSEIPSKDTFDLILSLADKVLIFGGNYFAHILPQGKHWIVWDKNNTMPTFGDAELIWTNIKRDSVKIKEFEYNGLIGKEKERFHPTQKPVKLLIDLINEYGQAVSTIVDVYAGSGTTLIASEQTNKTCFCCERSEHYCDVILNRWEQFTGQTATKIDD